MRKLFPLVQFNILNKAKQIGVSALPFGYCLKARWYFISVLCPLGVLIFSSHMYCTFARGWGGWVFPFTGIAYLQCNKTLTDKEKVRKKNKMCLSNSSPTLYALKGKHAQCFDSEWNVSGIGLFECTLISTAQTQWRLFLLTILSWVSRYYFGVRTPACVVPGLNFDLVKDERRGVFNHKQVPLHHVLHPVLSGALSSVAYFVLQTRPVVFNRWQWLWQEYERAQLADGKQ